MLQIKFSPREARITLPGGGMAIIFNDCQLQSLNFLYWFAAKTADFF
jgi:hypothetical protein